MLKLDATAQSSLITCAKLGFVGGAGTWGPGSSAGIKNVYIYDLSEKIVVRHTTRQSFLLQSC